MCVVGFVITHFLELVNFAKSLRKGCEKIAKKIKPLKIKHLMNFFSHFRICEKTPPQDPPHPLARFLHATRPFFLYISLSPKKAKNKKQKTKKNIERVRFDCFSQVFSQAFRKLFAKLTLAKNYVITKPHPAPPLHHPIIKPLKFKHYMIPIKPLKLKHLVKFLLS